MLAAARKMPCHGPGVTVLISDFLHPGMVDGTSPDYEKLLQYLRYCRQRPVVLHTMAPEELHVTLEGALNLIDAESQSKLRLTVDARAIDDYERALKGLTDRMKKGCSAGCGTGCSAGGGTYVLCDAGRDRRQLGVGDLRVVYDI